MFVQELRLARGISFETLDKSNFWKEVASCLKDDCRTVTVFKVLAYLTYPRVNLVDSSVNSYVIYVVNIQ